MGGLIARMGLRMGLLSSGGAVRAGYPALAVLTLSASSIAENAANGTVVGAIQNATTGSTLTLADSAGGKFAIVGSNLTKAAALDYETATSHNITIRETMANAIGSPKDTVLTINVTDVDDTAPTITSSSSASVAENAALAHALTANESVTWSIVGGADQARFEVSGSTLRWTGNGTKDYEAPDDANTDNAYIVQVRATDLASNTSDQTITVTVTDVTEGPTLFVTNGGFDADTDWTKSAASITIGSGKLNVVPAAGTRRAYQPVAGGNSYVAGYGYAIGLSVSGYAAGSVSAAVGTGSDGTVGSSLSLGSDDGRKTGRILVSTLTGQYHRVSVSAGGQLSIDDVVIYESLYPDPELRQADSPSSYTVTGSGWTAAPGGIAVGAITPFDTIELAGSTASGLTDVWLADQQRDVTLRITDFIGTDTITLTFRNGAPVDYTITGNGDFTLSVSGSGSDSLRIDGTNSTGEGGFTIRNIIVSNAYLGLGG